jgi:hypothetical protein
MHIERQDSAGRAHKALAFVAGLLTGFAAATAVQAKKEWMRSKQGRMMMARLMRMKLVRKAGRIKNLTKEKYEKMVDEIVSKIARMRGVPEPRLRRLRKFLLNSWEDVKSRLDQMKKEDEEEEEEEEEDDEEDEEDEDEEEDEDD